MDYIKRDIYLQKLIDRRDNGDVKVITGPRRCGKSWLLNRIYYDYLLSTGIQKSQIIFLSFDVEDSFDETNNDLLDSERLKAYFREHITDSTIQYYVMLDEVQEVKGFERIVNGLNYHDNIDVYVTGSNSHFLSSDINTIFRGRGDEVQVYPLSFKEFIQGRTESIHDLWLEYYTYGGMPALLHRHTPEQKISYLNRLWEKTYMADVVDRHKIRNREALECIVDTLCSSIGSLTNPSKIANTLKSVRQVNISSQTVDDYLGYLKDALLFEDAKRYNIKGRKYFESIKKYYAVDVGLRNARLNFRQQEPNHIMENVVFNELKVRGYSVDVGVVTKRQMINGKSGYSNLEIDFIATNGIEKYYIQSAYEMSDEDKRKQETTSLNNVDDSFRKIIIVGNDIARYMDNDGILYISLMDFLQGGSLDKLI